MGGSDRRDTYYYQAKSMGYRARSAFKLLDINMSYGVLKDVSRVVDLCAAPGSWSQVLRKKTKAKIVAVDVQEMAPIDGVTIMKEDITSERCLDRILSSFDGEQADLVVCDGAPDVTGFHGLDEFTQSDLLTASLAICTRVARPGSTLVAKLFIGEYSGYIFRHFSKFYECIDILKPKSSKSTSSECFMLCRGMKLSGLDPYSLDVDGDPMEFRIKSCGDESSFDLELV